MKHANYVLILPLTAALCLTGCVRKNSSPATGRIAQYETTKESTAVSNGNSSTYNSPESMTSIAENAKLNQENKNAMAIDAADRSSAQLEAILSEDEMSKLYFQYGRPKIDFRDFLNNDEITDRDGITLDYGLSKDDMRKALARGLGEYASIVKNNIIYP